MKEKTSFEASLKPMWHEIKTWKLFRVQNERLKLKDFKTMFLEAAFGDVL